MHTIHNNIDGLINSLESHQKDRTIFLHWNWSTTTNVINIPLNVKSAINHGLLLSHQDNSFQTVTLLPNYEIALVNAFNSIRKFFRHSAIKPKLSLRHPPKWDKLSYRLWVLSRVSRQVTEFVQSVFSRWSCAHWHQFLSFWWW